MLCILFSIDWLMVCNFVCVVELNVMMEFVLFMLSLVICLVIFVEVVVLVCFSGMILVDCVGFGRIIVLMVLILVSVVLVF